MKWSLLLLANCVILSGCGQFKNRLSCTLAGDETLVTSKYMNIGVTTSIAPEDMPFECKILQQQKAQK